MAITPFDASKAVTFDLPHGQVRIPDGSRGVVLPTSAILEVCRAADEALAAKLGQKMGESIGRAVQAKLASQNAGVREASLELVVDHLDGVWSIAGLGRLHFERWGQALVVVIDDGPFDEVGDGLMGSILTSSIAQAAGVEVRCVRLHRDGARARFLVSGSAGANRVRQWLSAGMPWGEALVRAHGGSAVRKGGEA